MASAITPGINQSNRQRTLPILINAIQIVALLALLFFIFHSRPYPKSDDWHLVTPLAFSNVGEFVSWLFEQHVDHRIPMQRLIQFSLAQASGYDMRVLMAFNAILALISSTFLVRSAYLLRGRYSIGDMIIPLIILTPAAGYSMWAVHLSFLSSVLFISITLFALARHQVYGRQVDAMIAFLCLALLPFCGMNGAIFSTVISAGLLAPLGINHYLGRGRQKAYFLWLLIPIAVNLLIWLSWNRVELPINRGGLMESLGAISRLFSSQMFHFSLSGTEWKALIVIGLALAALITTARQASRRQLSVPDYALSLVIIASLGISLAVITGRGLSQDLVFHYGNLMGLLPIVSWIILSKQLPRAAINILGLGLLLLYTLAYSANLEWRAGYILMKHNDYANVAYALRHDANPAQTIDKFKDEFVGASSETLAAQQRRWVIDSVTLLKSKGFYSDKR